MNLLFQPEALALLAAFIYACSMVLIRRGQRHCTPYASALIVNIATAVLFTLLFLATSSLSDVSWGALAWFALSGAAGAGVGRVLLHTGIDLVGVARSQGIVSSAPLVGVLAAVLWLGERPGLGVYAGAVLIVLGVRLAAREEGGKGRSWRLDYLFYPLATAVLYGLSPVLRKAGLILFPSPLLAGAVSNGVGIFCIFALAPLMPEGRGFAISRAGYSFIGAAALANSLQIYLNYYALTHGDVSVIVPLYRTSPLMVAALTALLLRRMEVVTGRVVGAGALVVVGVAAIAGGKGP